MYPTGKPGKEVQSVFDVIRLALSKEKDKKVDQKEESREKRPEDHEQDEEQWW